MSFESETIEQLEKELESALERAERAETENRKLLNVLWAAEDVVEGWLQSKSLQKRLSCSSNPVCGNDLKPESRG